MTKERIFDAAYAMAVRDGFNSLTRDSIAAEAGTAKGAINHHFGTVSTLRDEVVKRAISEKQLSILAQALTRGNAVAMTATKKLQIEALTSVAK